VRMIRTHCGAMPSLRFLLLAAVIAGAGVHVDGRPFVQRGLRHEWNWPQCDRSVGCGVSLPPAKYQRLRRDEYKPDDPFFQWYYFYLQDREEGGSVALAYAVSYSGDKNEGVYVRWGQALSF
jgi:hypothetical protein